MQGDRATVTLREGTGVVPTGEPVSREVGSFVLRLPRSQTTPDNELINQFEAQGVNYRFEPPSQGLAILLNVLPVLLLLSLPALLLAILLFSSFWRRPSSPR